MLNKTYIKTPPKEILCTLGPSSLNSKVISRLEDTGVSLFRINLSHTSIDDLKNVIVYGGTLLLRKRVARKPDSRAGLTLTIA